MRAERRWMAAGLAAILVLALSAAAKDHDQGGGSGSSAVSGDDQGDNHDQNENGGDTDGHQGGQNQNSTGNTGTDGGAHNGGATNQNSGPQRIRISLAPTDAGNAISATAKVDLRAQGDEQRLKVEMEANVADGTVFTLVANTTPIGTITIQLGEGEFEFDSQNGQTLLGGLLPAAITSLALMDSSNTAVLQATFGALSTSNPGLPPVLAVRKEIQLTATTAGQAVHAEGNADLRSGGADTRLKVEVEANVPDGTVWSVSANGKVALGTVTFKLMEAELHLDGTALAQAGITDPSTIASIQVMDAGNNPVLAGSF
jgi:hypothetical protein